MNSFPEGIAWAIFLLPVGSCVLITLGLRRYPRYAGYLTIACIFLAFVFSVWALAVVSNHNGAVIGYSPHEWLKFPKPANNGLQSFTFNLGLRIDGLTGVMLVVV